MTVSDIVSYHQENKRECGHWEKWFGEQKFDIRMLGEDYSENVTFELNEKSWAYEVMETS